MTHCQAAKGSDQDILSLMCTVMLEILCNVHL